MVVDLTLENIQRVRTQADTRHMRERVSDGRAMDELAGGHGVSIRQRPRRSDEDRGVVGSRDQASRQLYTIDLIDYFIEVMISISRPTRDNGYYRA